jgi:group I intron endonuclease
MDTLLESPYGHWDISLVGEFDPQEFWGFIYEITQKSTGKSYIGKKQFRFKRQKTKSNKSRTKPSDWLDYTSSSELVNDLITEYGKDDFVFRILLLCSGKCMLGYEEESIQRARNVLRERMENGELRYFNRTIGYKNFGGLEKQTEEAKEKMRAYRAAHPWSAERRAAQAAAITGRQHSDETKDQISAALKGNQNSLGCHYKLSDETRAKMSKAKVGNRNAVGNQNARKNWPVPSSDSPK